MTADTASIAAAEALALHSLIVPSANGIARRVLAKTTGGSVTLFAFDAGQVLAEHASSVDALVLVLEGALTLRIGGTPLHAASGTVVRVPAHVPHGVEASEPSRMLLVALRDHLGNRAQAATP